MSFFRKEENVNVIYINMIRTGLQRLVAEDYVKSIKIRIWISLRHTKRHIIRARLAPETSKFLLVVYTYRVIPIPMDETFPWKLKIHRGFLSTYPKTRGLCKMCLITRGKMQEVPMRHIAGNENYDINRQ